MPFDTPDTLLRRALFADVETIPTQRADIVSDIADELFAQRDAAIAALAPPGNYKKQETIDAWMATELPGKVIELTEQYEKKVAEAIHVTGLDGAFGQAAVVSMALGEEEPIKLFDEQWQEAGYEAWLLHETNAEIVRRVGRQSGFTLVGHNIEFDRRMLRQRGIVRSIRMHSLLTRPVKPWENDVVFDTMIAWTGDARLRVKLDKLCKALGIAGKGSELDEDIDGSMVWDFIRTGRIAKVATYCAGDVRRARSVWKRIHFLIDEPAVSAVEPQLFAA